MIGALKGTPIQSAEATTVIMVGGVGYEVAVTPTVRSGLYQKESVFLFVHTVVKQDSLDLYGFISKNELSMFKLLLGVSGVGPKTALTIVDFGVTGITNAIAGADVAFFTQIPKVGKKMAQKIIIELKSKVGSIEDLNLADGDAGETNDLIHTLVNMGYSQREAREMIRTIPSKITALEEKIVYVLKKSGT
jgi:holliday junction DNA helicase RuvA